MADTTFKELSIQVDLNGLSFCILDTSENAFTYCNRIEFASKRTPFDTLNALKAELSSNTIFSDDFKSVLVIHQNELSTLVPKALYDESNNADYLKFNSKILRTDFIASDTIDSINAVNVYIPYVNINNYIFETFGSFTYKHGSSIFIETIIKDYTNDQPTLFIDVHKEFINVLVTKEQKLELFNRFDYSSTEDFLYYILFVVEQLHLDPETLNTKLMGQITPSDALFKALYKYIRHVAILDCKSIINSDIITDHKLPNNFILLNSF